MTRLKIRLARWLDWDLRTPEQKAAAWWYAWHVDAYPADPVEWVGPSADRRRWVVGMLAHVGR